MLCHVSQLVDSMPCTDPLNPPPLDVVGQVPFQQQSRDVPGMSLLPLRTGVGYVRHIERDGKDRTLEARSLVFAIIGWQTMLYRPALGTCPPQKLAAIDGQHGYPGQAFMAFNQNQASTKRPLHEFPYGIRHSYPTT